MTNAEKYKDAIMAEMCKTGDWAVNKANEIINCDDCSECLFRAGVYCYGERKKWLNAEVKKVFSEKDKEVLWALDNVKWVAVARDEDGIIYGYHNKPDKKRDLWSGAVYLINLTMHTSAEFAPVKYEDDEPISREEILGDEK